MATWMSGVNLCTQYRICRNAVAAYALCEIWVTRYHATFKGSNMNAQGICLKVIHHTQLLSLVTSPKIHSYILDIMGINRTSIQVNNGLWCKWGTTVAGLVNIDDSARGGNIFGGGIIRNEDGRLIAASPSFYGFETNNLAEFLALKEGLDLCKTLSSFPVIIHLLECPRDLGNEVEFQNFLIYHA